MGYTRKVVERLLDAESKHLSGQGVARQRRAIVDGLKESVMDFNDSVVGTTPTDVMQLMMCANTPAHEWPC